MMYGIILADEQPETSKKLTVGEKLVLGILAFSFAVAISIWIVSIDSEVRSHKKNVQNKTRQEIETELENTELEADIYKTLWITNYLLK